MIRTKPPTEQELSYDPREEPLIINRRIMRLLKTQHDFPNLLSLYLFYYDAAKTQNTNQPRVTINFVMQGMHWGRDKVQRCKKRLKNLGLIQDILRRNELNQIVGHYILVKGWWDSADTTPLKTSNSDTTPLVSPLVAKPVQEILRNKKIKKEIYKEKISSQNGHIVSSQFEKFWELYPRKASKGAALTAWNKICRRPPGKRPFWSEIKCSIEEQNKSDQWQDKKYIPHPSTWLNQSRWLDDPKEMISYDRNDSPKSIIEGGREYKLDKDGFYTNIDGDVLTI